MTREQLAAVLVAEVDRWSAKSREQLLTELSDVAAYSAADGAYQVEVEILERCEYVHVVVAVDAGSFRRSFNPLCSTFLVHSDGRVEK